MFTPLLFAIAQFKSTPQAADVEHAVGAFSHSLSMAVPATPGKNILFSPYSVESCLAMLLPGVGDADRNRLIAGLHLPNGSAADLDEAFRMLGTNLLIPGRTVMQGANSVWTGPGIKLKPGYQAEVARAFGAQAQELGRAGVSGAQQVNSWVNQHTSGRIPHLFDSFPGDVRLVLVNTLTFDGIWDTPFNPNKTVSRPFHTGGSTLAAPSMTDERRLGFANGPGYSAVQIPYTGGRFRMIVLLPPNGGDPLHILRTIDVNALPPFRMSLVDLQLPKFKFHTRYDLTGALSKLGLGSFTHAFDASPMLNDRRAMAIYQLMHAGFIQVDEQGTKAAAATGGVIRPTAILAPPQRVSFHVDRPFAFLILDGALPVFEGAVYSPNAG
jgi:serpin B